MNSKVSTVIDEIDDLKLARMADRAGMSKEDAARIIYSRGVEVFLNKLVGATR